MAKAIELTDKRIRAINPTNKRQFIRDTQAPLWLVVQPSGLKSFQWRGAIDGQTTRKTLGEVGVISLADARLEALVLKHSNKASVRNRSSLPRSSQPTTQPKPAPIKPVESMNVRKAWSLYIERNEHKLKPNTIRQKWTYFKNDICPAIGHKNLSDVTRYDLEEMIAKRFAKTPVSAKRLYAHMTRFFNWCVKEGHYDTKLDDNPAANVAAMSAEPKPRSRFLTEDEIKLFLKALPQAGIFEHGYRALLYTGARKAEILGAKRRDLAGDLLSLSDTKNGTDTKIWLHPTVMATVPEIDQDDPQQPLFAGSEVSHDAGLRRVRAKMAELGGFGKDHFETSHRFTLHDLRRTMSNWMGDQLDEDDLPMIDPFTIERCLNHIEHGVRARHYSQNQYVASKKKAWRLWGDYLSNLV